MPPGAVAGPLADGRCLGRPRSGRPGDAGLERRRPAHAGHLAVLRRWAAGGLLITLMDGTPVVHSRPGESEEEMGRRWWSERDAAMADRVLAVSNAPGGWLVVAGNLHTRLKPLPASDPIAAQIGVPMGWSSRVGARAVLDRVCLWTRPVL